MRASSALLLVLLLIGLALGGGISLYIDALWFQSVGYLSVFQIMLGMKSLFWLLGFILSFAILGLNLWLSSRQPLKSSWLREEWVALARKGSNALFWLGILVISVFVAMIVQSQWMSFLQYWHRVPTGELDPIFGKDIAFYFFSLPAYEFGVNFGLGLVALCLTISTVTYVVHGHLGYLGQLQLTFPARLHLFSLAGIFFLFVAARFWLSRFGLLYSDRGVVFGAGYADINAWLPSYWILVVLSAATGVLFFFSTLAKTFRPAIITGAGFVVCYLIINIYPYLVQSFIVKPNELEMESPYLQHNIQLTLKAYDLENTEVRNFSAKGSLDSVALQKNQVTLKNIRLWDWRPLKDAYGQLQAIRPYYAFEDVDLDRYVVDGDYRQIMLSARELDFDRIPEQAKTFINQFFSYTHGYGLCMSPVNEVTPEGLPEFFLKDIPPRSEVGFHVSRPEIYFGEKTSHPVFVRTKIEEFDYPIGERNALSKYQAKRGLSIGSLLRRLLFSWELKDYQILFTPNFTKESQILLHRRIQDRVPKIAPFLEYDQDPYLVLDQGRLFWILDAYTTTHRYPYSQPFQSRLNYIRNAVKVVVDAYLGDVHFYLADSEDPLIRVYARIFPDLFRPLVDLPDGLRAHLRYPEDLFHIQSQLLSTYHMRDSRVFYNKEDLWQIPTEIYRGTEQTMESYYVIMSLPGAQNEEFILLIPFTPKNKDNMIAWLAARCDGENYGKLVLYQFPKQELTYGPMQIEARIDQDPNISQLITLWSQKGSQVIRGNLLVIPIDESILYVEPLYLQAEKSKIPELTRIIVVYRNRVAMGETLEEALKQAVLSGPPPPSPQPVPIPRPSSEIPSTQPLIKRALDHYLRSQRFLKEGSWTAYGEEQQRLGEILHELGQKRLLDKEQ